MATVSSPNGDTQMKKNFQNNGKKGVLKDFLSVKGFLGGWVLANQGHRNAIRFYKLGGLHYCRITKE